MSVKKILMSELIDNIKKKEMTDVEFGGEWWIAKPFQDYFLLRLKNAIKVLKGTARAFHYKEDEINDLDKLFKK